MPSDSVPDDVQDFIQKYVDSIAELEALLLLRGEASTEWNAAILSRRLFIDETAASELLKKLRLNGFLRSKTKVYWYHCSAELDAMVAHVAEVYSRQLIPVTHLIHSKPTRIAAFADAFKLRKEP